MEIIIVQDKTNKKINVYKNDDKNLIEIFDNTILSLENVDSQNTQIRIPFKEYTKIVESLDLSKYTYLKLNSTYTYYQLDGEYYIEHNTKENIYFFNHGLLWEKWLNIVNDYFILKQLVFHIMKNHYKIQINTEKFLIPYKYYLTKEEEKQISKKSKDYHLLYFKK